LRPKILRCAEDDAGKEGRDRADTSPFRPRGFNFTLDTTMGYIDLLAEITGGGTFEDLLPRAVRLDVFGVSCLCLDLDTLIHTKRAAGRPKDYEAVAELEVIREEREKRNRPGS
jgi:hypothetical protein